MRFKAKYDNSINQIEHMSHNDKVKFLGKFFAKSFLYAILTIFVVSGLLIALYFADLAYNLSKGNNKLPLFDAYIIVSPSMVPTIKVNDAIIIKREEAENLKIGDIITFSSIDPSYPGLIITHRIIGRQTSSAGEYIFRTKGDNNSIADPSLVLSDKVFGKVILKIPKLGFIRSFITTTWGFIITIIVPILIIIVIDTIKLKKKKEEVEVI